MAGINEMIFMKTSGMYDDDQAYRQRVQKYNEAVNQLQYNEQSGQFDYLKGSDLELRGQFNQAQGYVFQQLLGELNMVKQEVQTIQNKQVASTQANAVYDGIIGEDFSSLNALIGQDEKTKQMFNKLGVQSVQVADYTNPQHLRALRDSGVNPKVIESITNSVKEGTMDPDELKTISKAWPIVQGLDNRLSVASVPEFVGATRIDKYLGSEQRAKEIRNFISRSYSAMQGITDSTIDSKVAHTKAQTRGLHANARNVELTNEQLSNWARQFEQTNGRAATIQDYLSMEAVQRSSGATADMRDAQYFGNLKVKIDSGQASEEELAIYEEYMMKRGGVDSARSRAIGDKSKQLFDLGINLDDPNFNPETLPPEQKLIVKEVVRSLENTQGGKKLTANISQKLGADLGAVETTALKLSSLAKDKKVSTDAVMNATSAVKSYLPDSLREVTAEDLKNQEFKSAYLSSAAVFLKLQSGLTVSDREAANFANSFGTLNKNTKVNMLGLKTKLDEVIGSYEKNALLEPTLYNLKYKSGVSSMKAISGNIEGFLNGNTGAPKPVTQLPPEKVKQLDQIFGGGN